MATSGRFKGSIVRKSEMGVEMRAPWEEVRYIVSNFSPEAIDQAWKMHTCNVVVSAGECDDFPAKISYVPKPQKYKMEEYS